MLYVVNLKFYLLIFKAWDGSDHSNYVLISKTVEPKECAFPFHVTAAICLQVERPELTNYELKLASENVCMFFIRLFHYFSIPRYAAKLLVSLPIQYRITFSIFSNISCQSPLFVIVFLNLSSAQ